MQLMLLLGKLLLFTTLSRFIQHLTKCLKTGYADTVMYLKLYIYIYTPVVIILLYTYIEQLRTDHESLIY